MSEIDLVKPRACACRFDDDGDSAEPVVKCWYHKNMDEKFEVEKAKLTHKVEALEADLARADRFKFGTGRDAIYVETRGDDVWCVSNGTACLSIDGEWITEPSPSNRDSHFLADTRFTFEDAKKFARAALGETK